LSTVIVRGLTVCGCSSALRKNCQAAAASRTWAKAESRLSAPLRVDVQTKQAFDETMALVCESNRLAGNAVRASNATSANAVNTAPVIKGGIGALVRH